MAESCSKSVDPRIRRTRLLLQQALEKLLKVKRFEELSIQDIADAATVNRATFYDHYPDKFALLECLVATQFNALLAARGVNFDSTCSSALRGIVLGVCDFLLGAPGIGCSAERRVEEPHLESAIIAVVRRMFLEGLHAHPPAGDLSPEMVASAASWAIYGAAKEWLKTPGRSSSEEAAEAVLALVSPMLHSVF
ncbi:MAG: TetR/AcrR family transcriptional regulator, partial [Verrucomicrobia bacterium]|nr:TetR/AcrR family transcriptional regulator [Verrucomicrobiota bacterium]